MKKSKTLFVNSHLGIFLVFIFVLSPLLIYDVYGLEQYKPQIEITPTTIVRYGNTFTIHAWLDSYENKPDELRYAIDVFDRNGRQVDSTLWFARQDFVYEFDTTHPVYNITDGGTYLIKVEQANGMERTGIIETTLLFEIVDIFPPPLKQIKAGISLVDVKCNEGKVPAYKYNRMSIACVSLDTESELIMRGWALMRLTMYDIPVKQALCEYYGGDWSPWGRCDNVDAHQCSLLGGRYETTGCVTWDPNEPHPESELKFEPSDTNSELGTPPLQIKVVGENQVRRGTTHSIEIQVIRGSSPIEGARVFIDIEDYGEDIIKEFDGYTNSEGYFVFSWEIPQSFDDVEMLLAFIDVTDGISSKTELFKFQVYCLPGEKNCKAEGN